VDPVWFDNQGWEKYKVQKFVIIFNIHNILYVRLDRVMISPSRELICSLSPSMTLQLLLKTLKTKKSKIENRKFYGTYGSYCTVRTRVQYPVSY